MRLQHRRHSSKVVSSLRLCANRPISEFSDDTKIGTRRSDCKRSDHGLWLSNARYGPTLIACRGVTIPITNGGPVRESMQLGQHSHFHRRMLSGVHSSSRTRIQPKNLPALMPSMTPWTYP